MEDGGVAATHAVEDAGRGDEGLRKALRSLRRWTIALTVLVAMVLGVVGGVAGVQAWQDYQNSRPDGDVGPNPAMIKPLTDGIVGIYGTDAQFVDVYQVALTYADQSSAPDRPFAVSFQLAGPGVTVCGLVDNVAALGTSGLAPTWGDIESQLSVSEYNNLATTWKALSAKPMGFAYAYTSGASSDQYSAGDTITIDGKEYLVDHLWCVNEGWIPPRGSDVSWDAVPDVRALVFLRDAKTGTFTYIGSEPAPAPVYSSADGAC